MVSLAERSDGVDAPPYIPLKTVFIVDPLTRHRGDLAEALRGQYEVEEFADAPALKERLRALRPSLILVDEATPPDGGGAVVQRLRESQATHSIPIVGMTRSGGSRFVSLLHEAELGILIKPATLHTLYDAVTHAICKSVEDEWQTLEENQRLALTQTIAVFRDLPDQIMNGEPIEYVSIRESCAPIVTAVCNNQFSDLLNGVKGHDNYSYVHSVRVAILLAHFGRELGLPRDDLLTLGTGGVLHDLGKVAIPHYVLNKPGRLTPEEWVVMRSHVDRSIELLDCIEHLPRGVMTIAAQHHEKLDGTGYPHGLKGSELNELARMAAIVDVFGALTDQRIYKPPHAPDAALDMMREMGPNHLDQHLLTLFRSMLLDTASVVQAL
ncbi:HD domain-containing phosphohydrolase [Rhodospira trueperi]|uniref:response regulator n=1 Tax=Rhodospira trueperi TaxID=69960 RepID=UPI0015A39ED1|nr:HD domain-containing protein [Rhodospira trueperi]